MGLRSLAGSALTRVWFGRTSFEAQYPSPVAWDQAGNDVVAETLRDDRPCMVSRLGSSEVAVVSFYVRWRRGRMLPAPYPAAVRRVICHNAGFFPGDDSSIDRLAELYVAGLGEADVMAVWFQRGEEGLLRRFASHARLIELRSLIAPLFSPPWSAALAGRRVLVVHPFARTIAAQYATRRQQLFADPLTLPAFEIATLAPPQTIGGDTQGHTSWFDALDATQERIAAQQFDVALIGAGAYGLPLAAFVKSLGRQAAHPGGVTQLLFGIKGRRWEVESTGDVVPLFNDFWVRPSAEETPKDASLVEDGCYW